MVKVTDKQFYMDGYLQKNLDRAKEMIKKKFDLVLVIDGMERSGKSTLAMQIAYYFDPTFNLGRVCFTASEFRKAVIEAKNRQAIIMDEAMSVLFTRQAMSKTNIELIQIFGECGQKELILIVVLPTIFTLDNYIAIHRSRALLHVYTNRKLQRGFFTFYNVRRKKDLYLFGKVGYNYYKVSPNFRGRFTNYYPIPEKDYITKKRKYLQSLGMKEAQMGPFRQKNISLWIANVIGKLSPKQISKEFAKFGLDVPFRTIQTRVAECKIELGEIEKKKDENQ